MLDELGRLIASPTIAGAPNIDLISGIADELEQRGAFVTVLESPRPDGLNLHAVLGPRDEAGGVMLAAHTDVVDVAGQPWTRDPFALSIDGGRAYGRGSADMKGFIAVALTAIRECDPRRLRAPVHLCLSCDEELGCRGVGPLLDELAERRVRPAGVIIGEPTELRVVNRHKGKAATRIHVRGRAAHSSVATAGINAVVFAARLVVALEELGAELEAGPRDPGYRIPYATLGIGPIHGGVVVNIVPDSCTVDVEVRALPEQDPDALISLIAEVADELSTQMRVLAAAGDAGDGETGISLEPLSTYPGLAAAPDTPFAQRLRELTGGGEAAAADFGTEAGLYQRRLGVPVLVCGPGSMSQAHKADEYVEVAQLERALTLVRAVIATETA